MPAQNELVAGTVIAGDYRVVRRLAEGGMGAVYVVQQISTGRERALKVMQPQLVNDAHNRERFVQEARVGARIESDHVVEVLGAGVDEPTGMPWLAMELLRGETLAARIERTGPLAVAEALEVLRQLCHALGAAHRGGLVHRDLKPENLFLATARRTDVAYTLKVLDFGIAKVVQEARTAATATAAIGSPLWMAPEQTEARGQIRPATDVWALGLIAYFVLTGGAYWRCAHVEGAHLTALLREVLMEPLDPASARAAEYGHAERIPPGFDTWFARCVARSPQARYRDADEGFSALASALAPAEPRVVREVAATVPLSESQVQGLVGPTVPLANTPVVATSQMSAEGAATPSGRRGRALVVAAVALTLVAGGATAVLFARRSSGDRVPSAASTEARPSAADANAAPGRAAEEARAPNVAGDGAAALGRTTGGPDASLTSIPLSEGETYEQRVARAHEASEQLEYEQTLALLRPLRDRADVPRPLALDATFLELDANLGLSRNDEALACCRRVRSLSDGNESVFDGRSPRVRSLCQAEAPATAGSAPSAAADPAPSNVTEPLLRAAVASRAHGNAAAETAYQRWFDAGGRDAGAMSSFAYWLATRDDLTRAGTWARRATEQDPNDQQGWYVLGNALRYGPHSNSSESVDAFRRCAQLPGRYAADCRAN